MCTPGWRAISARLASRSCRAAVSSDSRCSSGVRTHLDRSRDHGQPQQTRLLYDELLVGIARRAAQLVVDVGADEIGLDPALGLEGQEDVQEGDGVGPAGDREQNSTGPGEQLVPANELGHHLFKSVHHGPIRQMKNGSDIPVRPV